MMNELGDVLARREPPPGLSAEELLSRAWWSGPEIFLIIDDVQQLPPGFDSPLQKAAPWVTRAADVGLHVIVTRTSVDGLRRGATRCCVRWHRPTHLCVRAAAKRRAEGLVLDGGRRSCSSASRRRPAPDRANRPPACPPI